MFDIRDHKWSNENIYVGSHCFNKNDLWFSPNEGHLSFNKDDSLAMAKHFYDRMTGKEKETFMNAITYEEINLDSLESIDSERFQLTNLSEGIVKFISHGVVYAKIPKSETDHLNSTPANKKRLEESIEQIKQFGEGTCPSHF